MGFGDFEFICQKAALPLCAAVGHANPISGTTGIQTRCYSRSIELANTIIFQGATDFMHILALIMTAIMIIHVRSKFTAVGMSDIVDIASRMDTNDYDEKVARKSLHSSTSTWSSQSPP